MPQQSSPPQQGVTVAAAMPPPMSDDQLSVWKQQSFVFGQIPETPPPDGLK